VKLIVAVIKAEDLGAVEAALDRRLNCLMSVTPMRRYGPEPCMAGAFRGVRYRVRSTYLNLEVAVEDDLVAAAAAAIHGATRDHGADSPVDPRVSVLQLDECGQSWSGD
jgi:nitrogen regulatory protein PII